MHCSTAGPRRRRVVLAIVASLALVGCGSSDGAGAGSATEGNWSFTDDLGRTVTLDERPDRIAGLNDPVASLWAYGIAPVATFGYAAIGDDERFDGRDTSQVVSLGAGYGLIDLEALAAADPDVIVTHAYVSERGGEVDRSAPFYGFADLAQQEAAESIAPIVVLRMSGSAVDVTQRHADLAVALGASADSGVLPESRARYDAAADQLSVATAGGLTTAFVYASAADGIYVARAADDPSLSSYADLGLRVPDLGGDMYYWTVLSWENADLLDADVIFWSQLDGLTGDEMRDTQPTFAGLPAAEADQLAPWVFATMDWPAQAEFLETLTRVLDDAADVA